MPALPFRMMPIGLAAVGLALASAGTPSRAAAVGGGLENAADAGEAFVGAGNRNTVSGLRAFIGSGNGNTAAGTDAGILGGSANSALGAFAVVAGGFENSASGTLSFAAGHRAEANHAGSFVWSDYVVDAPQIADTKANEFVVRASGGVYVYSNEATTSGVVLTPGAGAWANLSDRNAKTAIAPIDELAKLEAKLDARPSRPGR